MRKLLIFGYLKISYTMLYLLWHATTLSYTVNTFANLLLHFCHFISAIRIAIKSFLICIKIPYFLTITQYFEKIIFHKFPVVLHYTRTRIYVYGTKATKQLFINIHPMIFKNTMISIILTYCKQECNTDETYRLYRWDDNITKGNIARYDNFFRTRRLSIFLRHVL